MKTLVLKELVPLLVFVIAIIQIGLEYKWPDRRTSFNKILCKILIVLLIISAPVTMGIIYVDYNDNVSLKEEIDGIKNKVNNMPREFKDIVETLNKDNYKAYYDQAKFNYEAGMLYQQLGMNLEAAKAFMLFRDIAVEADEFQAAALSSLIAAFRFEDIHDFTKAGELQSQAGDFFIKLHRIPEAIVWKNKAIENYKRADVESFVVTIRKEIEQLKGR